jgi:hypothetical protein
MRATSREGLEKLWDASPRRFKSLSLHLSLRRSEAFSLESVD